MRTNKTWNWVKFFKTGEWSIVEFWEEDDIKYLKSINWMFEGYLKDFPDIEVSYSISLPDSSQTLID